MGDKHLFFWLPTNRMAPPAVFALPFFQLYSAVGLFDTHISGGTCALPIQHSTGGMDPEGFMSGVLKELDETAYVDGYSFRRFFFRIFMPNIKAGIGVGKHFSVLCSPWVELLLAKTLTAVDAKPIVMTMTKTASSAGYELGLLAAGCLTIIPGAIVIYFVRNHIAKGFALGSGVMLDWMAWTIPTALVFVFVFGCIDYWLFLR